MNAPARTLLGCYSTDEAPGAYPNGTRVRKSRMEPGDAHSVGTMATVIGSIGPAPPDTPFAGIFGYFVEWDPLPGVAVFVNGLKIERVVAS